jgi:hypothetical protein
MDLNQASAMQMLLNQVKMLQDQVTQLTPKPTELPELLSARLQGINGVPGYGASNGMEGVLQGMNRASNGMEGVFQGMNRASNGMEGILQGMNGASNMMEGSCVWANGIPEEFRNTKFLCNIFGNYGNVMKIKFSRKKPDGALIEMQDPEYAAKCCKYLHDVKLGGGRISVRLSKIPQVNIGQHEDNDTGMDFSRGFVHRYREKNAKFTQIIMKRLSDPTAILCISSVPEGKMSELKDYIVESGYTVKNLEEGKTKKVDEGESSKKKQAFAFVELGSTEEAIGAVGKLHNTMPSSIGEKNKFNRGLVFSFTSKRNI